MYKRQARGELGFQLLVNGFLVAVLMVVFVPLWRVVMTSLTPIDVFTRDGVPAILAPWDWSVAAYRQLLGQPSPR